LAWSLACCCVLVIPTLLVVLVGHLLIVLRSRRLWSALILLGGEIVGDNSSSHHGLLRTACLVRIIYLVASRVAMVPSTLSVHWRLASDHAALAHLLNYALHKLTGILKALELLGKLLVEWSQRQFLLTGPFWHRLQSSEQVVSDIV